MIKFSLTFPNIHIRFETHVIFSNEKTEVGEKTSLCSLLKIIAYSKFSENNSTAYYLKNYTYAYWKQQFHFIKNVFHTFSGFETSYLCAYRFCVFLSLHDQSPLSLVRFWFPFSISYPITSILDHLTRRWIQLHHIRLP